MKNQTNDQTVKAQLLEALKSARDYMFFNEGTVVQDGGSIRSHDYRKSFGLVESAISRAESSSPDLESEAMAALELCLVFLPVEAESCIAKARAVLAKGGAK